MLAAPPAVLALERSSVMESMYIRTGTETPAAA